MHTHIGAYHILHGVSFVGARGRGDDAARAQRRGQDDDAAHDHGPVARRAGALRFRGESLNGVATPDIARRGIAYVPESMGIFSDLTVQENLVLAARRPAMRASSTRSGSSGSSGCFRR